MVPKLESRGEKMNLLKCILLSKLEVQNSGGITVYICI